MDEYMHMSASLIRRLRIPTHRPLTLNSDHADFQVQYRRLPAAKDLPPLYRPYRRTLGLIDGDLLRTHFRTGTQTRSSARHRRPAARAVCECRQTFREHDGFLSENCTSQARIYGGLVYFFTPDGISLQKSTGFASVFPRFKRMTIPYSRRCVQSFDQEKAGEQRQRTTFFHEVKSRYQGHVFNEKFLDKNDVFALFSQIYSIRKHLPESHLFTNYEQLTT